MVNVSLKPVQQAAGDADLEIVVDPLGNAVVIAIMHRTRAAEHEEMWAQLYVDNVFEDVVRAFDASGAGAEATFVARFALSRVHLDGEPHRASIRFVRAVSRIVPRGEGSSTPFIVQTPEATAEGEFVGRVEARPR